MEKKVTVLLVEDDLDFVFLIQKAIVNAPGLVFLDYATSAAEGVRKAIELQPDIVTMDLNLSGAEMDGTAAAREIRLKTDAKIVLLTSFEQPSVIVRESKKAFASGYVFKSQCQTLADTIYKTATSRTPMEQLIRELVIGELTEAERMVLAIMLGDETKLASSHKTIANQKTSIVKKLGLDNRSTGAKDLVHLFRNW